MLARVLKNQETARFTPFTIPEIGEPNSQNQNINAFVIPDLTAFQETNEQQETEPESLIPPPDIEEILQQAQTEAARIIAQAEENSQIIAQVAHDKAVHEVQQKFEAEVAEKVTEIRNQLVETISEISNLANVITNRVEPQLIELALQIAKKIVGREVTIDREIALTLVKVSLGKLHTRSIAEVHLNPADFAFVQTHQEKLNFRGSLELVEDKSISVGGCLVHTETGDIDARIESQFDEIAHGLFS
ncbi:MAG TPA: FliH/SctL family protein [Pyrinomonadaceae bacterium]|nr:FliH/SctL family protein [Pyrinomonadaceae bacterium]